MLAQILEYMHIQHLVHFEDTDGKSQNGGVPARGVVPAPFSLMWVLALLAHCYASFLNSILAF